MQHCKATIPHKKKKKLIRRQSLGKSPLGRNEGCKAMAPHSSTLAWKISWMEEPGRL